MQNLITCRCQKVDDPKTLFYAQIVEETGDIVEAEDMGQLSSIVYQTIDVSDKGEVRTMIRTLPGPCVLFSGDSAWELTPITLGELGLLGREVFAKLSQTYLL